MNPQDLDEIENRLAARVPPTPPPELRGRILAEVHRALQDSPQPTEWWSAVLATAAAVLVGLNVVLSLFVDPDRLVQDRRSSVQAVEPGSRPARLPPEVSEQELQRLAFLLREHEHQAKAPVLPSSALRHLLLEDTSSWISH